MDKQKLIEKLAKKMNGKDKLNNFPSELYIEEATIAVEMFWPLVEALYDLRSMYPCDEDMLKTTPNGIMRGFSASAVNACSSSTKALKELES